MMMIDEVFPHVVGDYDQKVGTAEGGFLKFLLFQAFAYEKDR